MIEVQLKRSMHIAQMRIFLWQPTVMVFVPSFGHSDNEDIGKFMPAT